MEGYTKQINAITEALRAAEMRQGCTNHSDYAEILLDELGLKDMYEALNHLKNQFQTAGLMAGLSDEHIENELTPTTKALAKAEGKNAT